MTHFGRLPGAADRSACRVAMVWSALFGAAVVAGCMLAALALTPHLPNVCN